MLMKRTIGKILQLHVEDWKKKTTELSQKVDCGETYMELDGYHGNVQMVNTKQTS